MLTGAEGARVRLLEVSATSGLNMDQLHRLVVLVTKSAGPGHPPAVRGSGDAVVSSSVQVGPLEAAPAVQIPLFMKTLGEIGTPGGLLLLEPPTCNTPVQWSEQVAAAAAAAPAHQSFA